MSIGTKTCSLCDGSGVLIIGCPTCKKCQQTAKKDILVECTMCVDGENARGLPCKFCSGKGVMPLTTPCPACGKRGEYTAPCPECQGKTD